MTLNNLANLYIKNKQLKEAKEAYIEALNLYRDLAKQNTSAYGINYANTIVFGVHLLKEPMSNLKEAKEYLLMFKNNFKAKALLKQIEALENNNKI